MTFGKEPTFKFNAPLGRSLAMGDALNDRRNTVSPLVLEKAKKDAARLLSSTVGDPLSGVRFRADSFAAHLEGFMRAGAGELVVAAQDRDKPHVAAICRASLNGAGQKDSPHAHHVMCLATSMREAFAEAQRAIADTHRMWGAGGIETSEARHAVQCIVERVYLMGQTAIRFLGDVGESSGKLLGIEARSLYATVTESAKGAVGNFDRHEANEQQAKPGSGPRM